VIRTHTDADDIATATDEDGWMDCVASSSPRDSIVVLVVVANDDCLPPPRHATPSEDPRIDDQSTK